MAFYLGERGNTKGNASLSLRMAGSTLTGASLHSHAYQVLHRPRVARRIGRALAKRTPSDEELMGEMGSIAMMDLEDCVKVKHGPRGEVIEATLDLKDKVKAGEILGKWKRLGRDPMETLILKHVKRMAAQRMPEGFQGLMVDEGDEVASPQEQVGRGVGQVSPVPPPLLPAPSIRRAKTKRRAPRRRRSSAIDVEARVLPPDNPQPREAMPGHDAVQHEAMTQCVNSSALVEGAQPTEPDAPRRGPAPRPLHPRPPRR